MMKKIWLIGLIILTAGLWSNSSFAEIDLDEKIIENNASTYIREGVRFISLDDLAEILKAKLTFDISEEKALLSYQNRRISLIAGCSDILVDGKPEKIEPPPQFIEGVFSIPITPIQKLLQGFKIFTSPPSYQQLPPVLSSVRLPPNYKGNDIEKVYTELSQKMPPKGEFETTEKYEKRIQSVNIESTFVFLQDSPFWFFSYDTDSRLLTVELHVTSVKAIPEHKKADSYLYRYVWRNFLEVKEIGQETKTYKATNVFGATVEVKKYTGTEYGVVPVNIDFGEDNKIKVNLGMSPEETKEISENQYSNLKTLITCKPCIVHLTFEKISGVEEKYIYIQPPAFEAIYCGREPTFDHPVEIFKIQRCINAKILQILIYNTKTGKIYMQLVPKEGELEGKLIG